MAVTGDLADLNLSDLLIIFKMRASTGTLVVVSGDEGVSLHLEWGRLVRVSSTQVTRRLGERLYQSGKLSERQLAEALHIQATSQNSVPLGTLLLQLGMVTPGDLEHVLEGQAKEILYRALVWTDGSFSFSPAPNPSGAVPLPEINIDSVILDAMRRADEWEAERKQVTALADEVTVAQAPVEPRRMTGSLSSLSSLRGTRHKGALKRRA